MTSYNVLNSIAILMVFNFIIYVCFNSNYDLHFFLKKKSWLNLGNGKPEPKPVVLNWDQNLPLVGSRPIPTFYGTWIGSLLMEPVVHKPWPGLAKNQEFEFNIRNLDFVFKIFLVTKYLKEGLLYIIYGGLMSQKFWTNIYYNVMVHLL